MTKLEHLNHHTKCNAKGKTSCTISYTRWRRTIRGFNLDSFIHILYTHYFIGGVTHQTCPRWPNRRHSNLVFILGFRFLTSILLTLLLWLFGIPLLYEPLSSLRKRDFVLFIGSNSCHVIVYFCVCLPLMFIWTSMVYSESWFSTGRLLTFPRSVGIAPCISTVVRFATRRAVSTVFLSTY